MMYVNMYQDLIIPTNCQKGKRAPGRRAKKKQIVRW
jgi:hypothetical protein